MCIRPGVLHSQTNAVTLSPRLSTPPYVERKTEHMRGNTLFAAASAVTLAALTLSACGGDDNKASTGKITVSMGGGAVRTGTSPGHETCILYGGGKVSTGDKIKLSGNDGTALGFAEAEPSEVFLKEIADNPGEDPQFCGYQAVFENVPTDEISYTVKIPEVDEALEVPQQDIKDGITLDRDDGLGTIEGKAISISLGAVNSSEVYVVSD